MALKACYPLSFISSTSVYSVSPGSGKQEPRKTSHESDPEYRHVNQRQTAREGRESRNSQTKLMAQTKIHRER